MLQARPPAPFYSYEKREDAWSADEYAMDAVTVRFLNDDIARFTRSPRVRSTRSRGRRP